MYQQFEEKLKSIINENRVKKEELMSRHTTFKIGGPADYFISPSDEDQLLKVVELCKSEEIPYYVVGNGSNLLVGDYGFRGVIIEVKDGFSSYEINISEDGETAQVKAGAGIMLVLLANKIAAQSFAGFEFAAGIPGTLGGAVAMNAGAYGGEIKDAIVSARVLTDDGQILDLNKKELELGYRKSIVTRLQYIVLGAVFEFKKGDLTTIKDTIKDFNGRRREKQPLEYPSAGSTFKRPEGYFAGKLIMDAGLRGFRVGDVMVSEKHCGFVVNVGAGTASQVRELITKVSEKVYEEFKVKLEPEVRFIGEFEPGRR